MSEELGLVHYDAMRRELALAHDLDEVKDIRDKAEALRMYAKQARLGLHDQNRMAEIKLRAERRAGELLAETVRPGNPQLSHDAIIRTLPKGVSLSQSSRWQRIAAIPQDEFEQHIEDIRETDNRELTTASALRLSYRIRNRDAPRPAPPMGKYSVIYADPPWQYDDHGNPRYGHADTHYSTMSILELCALPIERLADDNAVLFLWVTSPQLNRAFELIEAWRFVYKASFVWDKDRHNYGHYNSVRHEFLLVATRGSFLPEANALEPSVVTIPRTAHSEKPPYFRELIDRMYPSASKIELFARVSISGWECWGNEITGQDDGERGTPRQQGLGAGTISPAGELMDPEF